MSLFRLRHAAALVLVGFVLTGAGCSSGTTSSTGLPTGAGGSSKPASTEKPANPPKNDPG